MPSSIFASSHRPFVPESWARSAVVALLLSASAFAQEVDAQPMDAGLLSPLAEEVAPEDAWRLAEQAAAERPGSEIFIGRGGSMTPLYPDRTVVVVEPIEMSKLRVGMTVVFCADSGRLVAHTLVARTARGWIARGAANDASDDTLVRFRNYVGTVVRAFAPGANTSKLPRLARGAQ